MRFRHLATAANKFAGGSEDADREAFTPFIFNDAVRAYCENDDDWPELMRVAYGFTKQTLPQDEPNPFVTGVMGFMMGVIIGMELERDQDAGS